MQKKDRNSREDKSAKPGNSKRLTGSKNVRLKTGRTTESNSFKDKKFGDDDRKPFPKRTGTGDSADKTGKKETGRAFRGNPSGGGRTYKKREEGGPARSAEGRPYGKREENDRPFKTSVKPAGKRGEEPKRFSKPSAGTYRPKTTRWSSEERFDQKPATRGRKNALPKDDGLIRLNRYISNAGICSRRKADELIAAGVVSVNGEVVTELGTKVNPAKDLIRYNGEVLKRERMVYVLLNKPKDYITTTDDPHERHTVMHLVEKASSERIYPVGRLDRNTTGLLLLTNDGELTDKLSHPRNNITKIYHAELNKNLTQGDLNKIAYGLELEDGVIKPDEITYVQGGSKREIGIQIHSGKNRIVRRIFEHLGYEVVKLDRVIYANLTKKDLPRGRWRYLDEKEVVQLKHLI